MVISSDHVLCQNPAMLNHMYISQSKFSYKIVFSLIVVFSTSSCTLLLLNGNISLGSYESKSRTFKCKLPGGALSKKVKVEDRSNELGETVTFSLDIGLLWRIDHLLIGKHKLAMLDISADRRQQLDLAKDNYMSLYLAQHAEKVEVEWEQYVVVDKTELLLAKTFVKWDGNEEERELLFSVDGEYLNVIHYAQNLSSNLQSFTTGAAGFYKGCEFH